MMKFDPPQELTNEEITQILREMYGSISDEQMQQILLTAPTLAKYMVPKEE